MSSLQSMGRRADSVCSRSEYLRRALVREQATTGERVTVDDLAWFSEQFADLADEGVMRSAWD